MRLAEARVAGFEDAKKLLAHACILDGHGDRFEYLCKVATAQGAHPIVFLDGDKRRRVEQSKFAEKCPLVPLILLDPKTEFEELIPTGSYFQGLADYVGKPNLHFPN